MAKTWCPQGGETRELAARPPIHITGERQERLCRLGGERGKIDAAPRALAKLAAVGLESRAGDQGEELEAAGQSTPRKIRSPLALVPITFQPAF